MLKKSILKSVLLLYFSPKFLEQIEKEGLEEDLVMHTNMCCHNDHNLVAEVLSDFYLKLCLHPPPIERITNLRAWLKTTIRNTVTDRYRSKNRKNTPELCGDMEQYEDYYDEVYNHKSGMNFDNSHITIYKILRCAATLSPKHKEIFRQRFLKDIRPKEIKINLNVKAGTLTTTINRIKKEIVKKLK